MRLTPTGSALARQFRAAFEGLRDVITKVPDDQWLTGDTRDQVPARRATHTFESAVHHCQLPKGCQLIAPRRPAGAAYPSREDLLAYVTDLADQVEAALGAVTDEQLAAPNRRFETVLEYWLYALRHIQHHVGQLSSTLRERRLRPMKWH